MRANATRCCSPRAARTTEPGPWSCRRRASFDITRFFASTKNEPSGISRASCVRARPERRQNSSLLEPTGSGDAVCEPNGDIVPPRSGRSPQSLSKKIIHGARLRTREIDARRIAFFKSDTRSSPSERPDHRYRSALSAVRAGAAVATVGRVLCNRRSLWHEEGRRRPWRARWLVRPRPVTLVDRHGPARPRARTRPTCSGRSRATLCGRPRVGGHSCRIDRRVLQRHRRTPSMATKGRFVAARPCPGRPQIICRGDVGFHTGVVLFHLAPGVTAAPVRKTDEERERAWSSAVADLDRKLAAAAPRLDGRRAMVTSKCWLVDPVHSPENEPRLPKAFKARQSRV